MSATDAGLNRQAIKLYQAGHFREAERMFHRLLEQDADNWQFALMIGLCRQSQGDYDEAVKWVKRSVELGDGQPATHYYLGRLMTDRQQPAAAREQYAQAIALDPNHIEARTAMGLVSLMTGDFKRAASELKTALRAKADHPPALTALARALLELDERDEAYQYASKALKREPENPVALDVMGRVLLAHGYPDQAEQCFTKALEQRPDNGELHAQLGAVHRVRHRDAEALQHYVKALETNAATPSVVIDTSVSLERIGDIAQARKLLQKAASRWPQDRSISLRLAELSLLDGAPDAATQVLEALDPEEPEVSVMQARVADSLGDSQRAQSLLEPIIAADADERQREGRLLLARVLSSANPDDVDAARAPIAGLLDRKTPVPEAVVVWSIVLGQAGRYSEAAQAIEDLLERDVASESDTRILRNRLANCYDAADERALAWANWQKGQWRAAPHLARLQAQRESGALHKWLEHDWAPFEPVMLDDDRPAPVIVAGWPGTGREILLSALVGHPEVTMLDPQGETRRLESIGVPAMPDHVVNASKEQLLIGRKRFLRGIRRESGPQVVLDAGWWPASAIPALARYFPGTTVVFPQADADDMAVQWRSDGYAGVDDLVADYRRELELWERMREHLDLRVIDVGRSELVDDASAAAERVIGELGLPADPRVPENAMRIRDGHRFVPEGRGKRYRTLEESQ
ncbi:MAG: tetratricopeptide repeat protein [Candidatus Wenzhouxiangella sp. M2_3B_020]